MTSLDNYSGCFLGLLLGDAYGARYEGGLLERLLWRMLGKTKDGKLRFTDDTQMSLDVANSFLANGRIDQALLAQTFAESYRWSRGYGPSAAKLLKKIRKGANWFDVNKSKFKDGSFGNGAAMRAAIVTLCFPNDLEGLAKNVANCAVITHAHPLAIEGARLIAFSTHAALNAWNNQDILKLLLSSCQSSEFSSKLQYCADAINAAEKPKLKLIKQNLGNGIAALESCVTAIYFALSYRDQELPRLFQQIIQIGGDTDTICAMSGALWGAFNGKKRIGAQITQNVEGVQQVLESARLLYLFSSTKAS